MESIAKFTEIAGPICFFLGLALTFGRIPLGRRLFPSLSPELAAKRVAGIAIVPLVLACICFGITAYAAGARPARH
jgi:hypothetical protein